MASIPQPKGWLALCSFLSIPRIIHFAALKYSMLSPRMPLYSSFSINFLKGLSMKSSHVKHLIYLALLNICFLKAQGFSMNATKAFNIFYSSNHQCSSPLNFLQHKMFCYSRHFTSPRNTFCFCVLLERLPTHPAGKGRSLRICLLSSFLECVCQSFILIVEWKKENGAS